VLDDEDIGAARRLIEAADLTDAETLDEIGALRFSALGEQAARDVLGSGAPDDALWAAAWVYASSASDPEPLRPLLVHTDTSIRVIAAGALVSLGDPAGFEPLGALLTDDDQLAGSHPPVSIGSFATQTLSRYVEAAGAPAEPASADELAAAQANWVTWLEAHWNELHFDAQRGTWMLP
jgi:hypothetical protein